MDRLDIIVRVMERDDPWKYLRQDLFRNEEPNVDLIAMTQPMPGYEDKFIADSLPGYTARHSYESQGKYTGDPENDIELDRELTRKLIKRGHHTPLETVQYEFEISGVSKSLAGQWTRHRLGLGWTFRSTRFVDASQNTFVYSMLPGVEDEEKVKELLHLEEELAKKSIEDYNKRIELGATRQDSRRIMPVFWSTHSAYHTNARAMRHFLELRLSPKAEHEIRRLARLFLIEVMKVTPTLYEDIYNMYFGNEL